MKNACMEFEKLLKDLENIDILYQHFQDKVVIPIDISDLLRWQWVQCVSAFDKLIHDIVRIGMVESYLGKRMPTPKYDSFLIDLKTYKAMFNDTTKAVLHFEKKIIVCNGYKAFQDPDKVTEALAYIWDEKDKWSVIANKNGLTKERCKTTLRNIVMRRNQIVHQGDYTDKLSSRQEIFYNDVKLVKDFVANIGVSIYNCVKLS